MRPPVTLVCANCEKPFRRYSAEAARTTGPVYCTRECVTAGRRRPDRIREGARLLKHSKKRAKLQEMPFALILDDVVDLLNRADGRCELTGLPFCVTTESWHKNPWAASIDRIDSMGGYTVGNCRMVCCAINMAMNEWGEAVFKEIAEGYLKSHVYRTQGRAATESVA